MYSIVEQFVNAPEVVNESILNTSCLLTIVSALFLYEIFKSVFRL